MTIDEWIALARRAVACAGWRWMPGMLAWRTTHREERVQVRMIDGLHQYAELADPRKSDTTPSGARLMQAGHAVVDGWCRLDDLTPDLTDAATVGCLLALVREARREPVGFLVPVNGGGWLYYTRLFAADWFSGVVEAEALVIALEAA